MHETLPEVRMLALFLLPFFLASNPDVVVSRIYFCSISFLSLSPSTFLFSLICCSIGFGQYESEHSAYSEPGEVPGGSRSVSSASRP